MAPNPATTKTTGKLGQPWTLDTSLNGSQKVPTESARAQLTGISRGRLNSQLAGDTCATDANGPHCRSCSCPRIALMAQPNNSPHNDASEHSQLLRETATDSPGPPTVSKFQAHKHHSSGNLNQNHKLSTRNQCEIWTESKVVKEPAKSTSNVSCRPRVMYAIAYATDQL